jgi:hypothetical protein
MAISAGLLVLVLLTAVYSRLSLQKLSRPSIHTFKTQINLGYCYPWWQKMDILKVIRKA